MNYLFILEPSIELGNPEFRFATLRNSITHQIKALYTTGNNTHLIMGDAVANKAMQDGFLKDLNSISIIDHFEWTHGENSFERSIRHQSQSYKDGEIDRLQKIIRTQLPDNFEPNVIIVWESSTYYLEKIFPDAKIIYQMPGFFSRSPFPEMIKFDTGLLDKATDLISTTDKNIYVDQTLNNLRSQDKTFFRSLRLVEPHLSKFKSKFQGIVLLPLQIDHYFMVDYLLERKSQFDIVLDLLQKTPSNIGVLVTNYWSGRLKSSVLSEENIRYLRSKFDNFVYIEKFNSIPSVSQLLLPLINGVYTISSSVGYQAAYWSKPVFSIGTSHITKYNTAKNLKEFLQQVERNEVINQDGLIKKDLLGSNYPMEWIKSKPQHFVTWLNSFVNPAQSEPWTTEKDLLQEFSSLRREQAYIKNSGYVKSIKNEHTLTHCTNLSEQIHKHDIVSFDIFDTLLFRPFKRPSDMFDFMSDDVASLVGKRNVHFKEIRRQSEKLAFEAAISRGEGETHIDEIYKHFQELVNCSSDQAEKVKALEMQMEYDLLYVRESAKTAFNLARALGKRVIIISDMYLPQDFLEKILHKNGYQGYDKIFVSSEAKQKKHSGRLFDHVLAELNVPAQTILHVGDNLQADVIKAKERGIKPFHLVKASEVFEQSDAYKSVWTRDEERHSLDAQMLISVIGNTLQDNPYIPNRRGTLFSGDAWRLGYHGFGMFLLGYAKWILEQSIRDNIDRLYFLSRDGLIMKQAYDLLAKNYPNAPTSHYLLCSRRAVNLAKIKDESGIIDLLNVDYAQTSISHLFSARFGLNSTDIDSAILQQYGFTPDSRINAKHRAVLKEILLAHQDKICIIAERERNNYLQYLDEEALLDNGNIAVVDIGYAGTMQESLYELTERQKEIHGYYLMTFRQAIQRIEKNGLSAKGYLANFVDRHDTYHPFCKFVPLYETLFSNTETSFIKMEKDWNDVLRPIHMDRFPQEGVREDVVTRIHAGALQFIDTCSTVIGSWIHKLDIEPNKSMRVLDKYFSNPHPVDAKIMCGVVFEDAYGGAGLKTILPKIDDLDKGCVWQIGRDSLCKAAAAGKQTNKNVKFAVINDIDYSHTSDGFKRKVISFIIGKTVSQKKHNKFIRSPRDFFEDSKSIVVKSMGKIYLTQGNE
ncbi:MAG: HAD family hydrolase [Plesiomonas sp.]|uniref:HAD family hydrolase n=1 Tax=Plesiomonas sp. TaxID=2486279 RepID=UPI003F2DEB3F